MKSYSFFYILICFGSAIGFSQTNHLNFDGTNDFVVINHHTDLNFSGDFTIEMKFKREREGIREDLMDKKKIAPGTSSLNDIAVTINTANKIVLWFKESEANKVLLTSTTSIEIGEWYHVVSVREGTTVKLYVNGVLEASQYFNGNLTSNGPLRIGSNRTVNNDPNSLPIFPFDGGIDEFRLWSYARTITEINDNLNTELVGDEDGLKRYYSFNQGIPCGDNLAIDSAIDLVSGFNGDLVNFSLTSDSGDPCTSNWVGRNNGQNLINEIADVLVNCYPNPSTNSVILEFDIEISINTVLLYDMAGRLVLENEIENEVSELTINIAYLENGQYTIYVKQNNKLFYLTQIQKM